VQFLAVGLRKGDHCVIFGYDEANKKVCRQLEELGFDLAALIEEHRVHVLGAKPSGDETLGAIGAVFQEAVANGAPLIFWAISVGADPVGRTMPISWLSKPRLPTPRNSFPASSSACTTCPRCRAISFIMAVLKPILIC
jgi:KaiC/GvpD/RAD55 family RecA-like ATPase